MSDDIIKGNKSVCIVASTIPANVIESQFEVLDVHKIIVMSNTLELSYKSIKEKHPSIQIKCAPNGTLALIVFFLVELLFAKFSSRSIVFFHECSLTILDLLVWLLKPSGYYLPQVAMAGFEEIQLNKFPKRKIIHLIRLLGLVKHFRYYRSPEVGNGLAEYVMSIRNYPNSIISKDVSFSRNLVHISYEPKEKKSKRLLFITGKSFIPDAVQIQLYTHLIAISHSIGYECHIKDHPNPLYRLNLSIEYATSFDPLIPSELLTNSYHLILGVSSTALLVGKYKTACLVNLMPEMSAFDRSLCIEHFNKSDPNNKIIYINSVDEFKKILLSDF